MAALADTRLPMDEVREAFEARANHFARIEEAAEALHASLSPGDDLSGAMKAWLRREHGLAVRTLPVHVMPTLRRRFDRHSMRLFVSERLSPFDQLREIAIEVASIACHEAMAPSSSSSAYHGRSAAHRPLRTRALCCPCADDALCGIFAARAADEIHVAVLAARFQVSTSRSPTV